MAYTKTPTQSTYQTKRVPMLFENEARAWDNYDTQAQNVLFELYKGEVSGDGYFQTIKRPGIIPLTNSPTSDVVLGIYYSDPLGALVYCSGGNIRVSYNGAETIYAVPGMFLTDQRVGFTDFLYQDGHVDIIVTDGTVVAAVNVVAGTISYTTGAPTNVGVHRPYPVFLDGYLFLADEKGDIWNSNLNNPLTFSASNFLGTEAYPDTINSLVRVDNYVVALGYSSIEYFYDAANLNGSPLARYDSGSKPLGTMGAPAVVGNVVYFVGARQNVAEGIYSLENFKLTKISNNSLDRRIQHYPVSGSVLACNPIALGGHTVIGVSMWLAGGVAMPAEMQIMPIYDLDTGLWTTFQYNFTAQSGPIKQTATFAFTTPTDAALAEVSSGFILAFQKDLYRFATDAYNDLGVPITVGCRTRVLDFDTRRTKFLSRVLYTGDQLGTVAGQILAVRIYVNDRQQSYGAYSIPVESSYPAVYPSGMFRNICFELVFEGDGPLRFNFLEIDYNQGDS